MLTMLPAGGLPAEQFVPHEGAISLLDRVLTCDAQSLRASAIIRTDNPFLIDGVVPASTGLEYMAQAIAAWAGVKAVADAEPIKLGFLVGTRSYVVSSGHFDLDTVLDIFINRIMQGNNGLNVFDCDITFAGGHARAKVNVFQPDDIEAYLGGV